MKGWLRILVVAGLAAAVVGVTIALVHHLGRDRTGPVEPATAAPTAPVAVEPPAPAPPPPAAAADTITKAPLRQPQRRTVPTGIGIVRPEAAVAPSPSQGAPSVAPVAPPARVGATSRIPVQRFIDTVNLTDEQRAAVSRFDAEFQPVALQELRVGDDLVQEATVTMQEAYVAGNTERMNEARALMKQAVQMKMEALEALGRKYVEGIRPLLTPEQAALADEFLTRPQAPGVEIAVPLEGTGPADPNAADRKVHGVIPLEGAPPPAP
ncbi:MAG: hypothetical protein GXY74_03985 [Phycisphaerae bacterium]|nr:hypothetical protein [Phycisphaerae bacterium]